MKKEKQKSMNSSRWPVRTVNIGRREAEPPAKNITLPSISDERKRIFIFHPFDAGPLVQIARQTHYVARVLPAISVRVTTDSVGVPAGIEEAVSAGSADNRRRSSNLVYFLLAHHQV